MKWLNTIILFDQGGVINSDDWETVHKSYVRAIESIDHPLGSGSLTIREKTKIRKGRKTEWKRNGVGFLRKRFLEFMLGKEGWQKEGRVSLSKNRDQQPLLLYPSLEPYNEPITSKFGGFDFVTTTTSKTRIAIEWETGNISSSHRSMNKLTIALSNGIIDVGVLIVPSRALYEQLTDRIGNIGELSGYLAMWESQKAGVKRGLLAITVVEHDHLTTDENFPYLTVGNDGRAKEGRSES